MISCNGLFLKDSGTAPASPSILGHLSLFFIHQSSALFAHAPISMLPASTVIVYLWFKASTIRLPFFFSTSWLVSYSCESFSLAEGS